MQKLKIFFLTLFLFASYSSFAWWGQNGHRIVGEIAESYLSNKAKKAIREILGDETVAMASTWADFIKSDTAYNYLSSWHYINLPERLSQAELNTFLQNDNGTDAYTKLNFLIGELKNKDLDADKKRMYLRLLIHIVGDIHQPLHTGREEDYGGNRIRVQWFGEPTNLHSLWDEKLIEYQKLSYTEYAEAINHTNKAERLQWQTEPMTKWFFESYQLANKVYNSVSGTEPRLSYRYNFDYIDLLDKQLLKAGVRLAGLLNDIFK